MKKNYSGANGLDSALNDLNNDVVQSKRKRTKSLTNEYVLNTTDRSNKIVPYDTGALVSDVVAKTEYDIGLVQTTKSYAVFANDHNITGEEDFLEYEMEYNSEYYRDVYKKLLEDSYK